MDRPDLGNASKVCLSDRLRYRTVGDEGVLVHLENGRVLVVNEVGMHCVQALARRAMTVPDLVASVVEAFDVDAEQARADVEAFLDELHAEQAIEAADAASGS